MACFEQFTFAGSPSARGHAYGEALRDRIHATYALYADSLFSGSGLPLSAIEARARHARELIAAFAPDFTEELDAVAAGAAIPATHIYTLNARTEILNAPTGECTAAYFSDTAILGQNWDWVEPLESLAVLVTWELPHGPRVLAFTEPGMLGKIGCNDAGIGVCLNILFSAHELDGVPVHVLTRAVLDCTTIEQVRTLLDRAGLGKSSHLLVADEFGQSCSTEFAAGERFEVSRDDGVLLHTNHCIARGAENKAARIPTTVERLAQAETHIARTPARDLAALRTMLLDSGTGAGAINVAYHPEPLLDNQPVGTVASILMELSERRLHIKRGPGADNDFITVEL